MKIITCASYHNSGSSAISDFFTDFDNVTSLGDYEFRIPQDLDGISDLEYYVVENNHRNNTSQEIKRFLRLAKRLNGTWYRKDYERFLGPDFLKYTNEYINSITEMKAKAFCAQDQANKGQLFSFFDRSYNKIMNIIMDSISKSPYGRRYSFIKNSEYGYFTNISEEQFLYETRRYMDKVFNAANKDNNPYMVVDQLVPPSNIARYIRYFNDICVFIVDRDPRDIYIEERNYDWGTIPLDSVEEYCNWFQITRAHRKKDEIPSNVHFIQFEDMIYDYENTKENLMSIVGLDEIHFDNMKKQFDPNKSKNNTNLIKKYPKYTKEIEYISERLSDYLYNFE